VEERGRGKARILGKEKRPRRGKSKTERGWGWGVFFLGGGGGGGVGGGGLGGFSRVWWGVGGVVGVCVACLDVVWEGVIHRTQSTTSITLGPSGPVQITPQF